MGTAEGLAIFGTEQRPVRTWFFGQWLTDTESVPKEAVDEALALMKRRNRRLGDLAVSEQLITEEVAREIQNAQRGSDSHFGEMAIALGHLDTAQVQTLLQLQKRRNIMLGDALVALEHLTEIQLSSLLVSYQSAVQSRVDSADVPNSLMSSPALICLIDVLPRTFRRASQLLVKLGSPAVWSGADCALYSSCALYGSQGLRVCLSIDVAVGEALARNALQLPEDEPVEEEFILETLQEVLSWLLETTANALGETGQQPLVGFPSDSRPEKPAVEFPLLFAEGNGQIVVSKGSGASPSGLRPAISV